MWSKKELNILPGVKSQDKQNRKTMPENIKIPDVPNNIGNANDKKHIEEAKKYVMKHFPDNYGNVENFIFPISHKTVNKWLDNFINKKFKLFGDYQDYIKENENFMFHSLLSTSINIGLLNPIDIIEKIKKLNQKYH